MKTESDVRMEYLKDTGTRAEVEDAGDAYCDECGEEISTGYDGVNISREYYDWLIEKITTHQPVTEFNSNELWNDALDKAISEIEYLKIP